MVTWDFTSTVDANSAFFTFAWIASFSDVFGSFGDAAFLSAHTDDAAVLTHRTGVVIRYTLFWSRQT